MTSVVKHIHTLASFVWNEWLTNQKECSPLHTRLLFQPPSPPVSEIDNEGYVFHTEWYETGPDAGAGADAGADTQPDLENGVFDSMYTPSSLRTRQAPVMSSATYLYLAPPLSPYKSHSAPRRLLVFFHGNATNIVLMQPRLEWLQQELNRARPESYHVLSVEYDGYTEDTHGLPIVADRIADKTHRVIEHMCRYVFGTLRSPASVVFFGESIGTGIASLVVTRYYTHLATMGVPFSTSTSTSASEMDTPPPPPTLVLLSPFSSFRELARDSAGQLLGSLVRERFDTIGALRTLRDWRLLIMHGVADDLVPIRHSEEIYTACSPFNQCTFVPLDGDHNNLNWHEIVQSLTSWLP